jgi:CRP-like cAMP-binding protein
MPLTNTIVPNSRTAQGLLLGAQVLALLTLIFGLMFLLDTTAGSVFLFSTLSPLLIVISMLILIGVAIQEFRKRHSLFQVQICGPGKIIFREGDPGECAYFIQSGEVEVLRHRKGGNNVVARLSAGQYFGEMALLADATRNATIRTVTETRLAVLGKKNFLTMVSTIPVVREDLMKTIQERAMKQGA